MMAILAVHLVLHWKWIVCAVRGKSSSASGYRFAGGCIGLVFLLLLSAAPLLSPTARVSRGELRESRISPGTEGNFSKGVSPEKLLESSPIRGSMTLHEIAEEAHVSLSDLIAALGLPPDLETDSNAGQLLRRHGLRMSDLRDALNRLDVNQRDAPRQQK
jgi:hypothetical protein